MSTISSLNNSNTSYNPQITTKVATESSANAASNAANQSAFSSYIGQALAQIGIANPTNATAPVVSSASKSNSSEQSLSTFIQDLFSILSQKDSQQGTTIVSREQSNFQQFFSQDNESSESSSERESNVINEAAIAAYSSENVTTVGNLATNLQLLVKQLNDESRNTANNSSSTIQALKDGFQSILNAQGVGLDSNNATLGNFLQTLAQNLQGQSPLGIIVNVQA